MGSSPTGGDPVYAVPVAKWTRRRFPEPKIVGSSPIWDDIVFFRASRFGLAAAATAASRSACSVMVIIGASQALDPGSIPGKRSELGH